VHIYILGPKLLRWNFFQTPQLSIRSGAHKLLRRFLNFCNFWPRFLAICSAI